MTNATTVRPTGAPVPDFTAPPPPGPDEMVGRYVRLERLDAARHGTDIVEAARGADWIWDYLGYGPFDNVQAWANWATPMAAAVDPFFYAICVPDDGGERVLGQASFLRIDDKQGVIEVGHILMTPPLQRTVAASEAIILMIDWAMQAGYRRFEWKCDALNGPSRKAALRFGFTFEGIFRQHMMYKGRNRDTAWYSIIDSEWPALKAAYMTWLSPDNFDDAGRQRQSLSDLTETALPGRR